jgi:multidrug resistance efflux pump
VRGDGAPSYSPAERLMIAAFAEQGGPILQAFLYHHQMLARAGVAPAAGMHPRPGMTAAAGTPPPVDLLRRSPRWIRWSYRLLLVSAVAGLLVAALARIPRTTAGSAVVRLESAALTAPEAATVEAVHVVAGARVRRGDVLVDFHSAREVGELAQLEAEQARRQAAFRRHPSDGRARRALADIVALVERARAGAAERSARAPSDGVVTEVRARPGMKLAAGDLLVTMVDPSAPATAIILLPGGDRVSLAPGMTVRVDLRARGAGELAGTVEEVGREVLEPAEARRLVGGDAGDALAIGAPVVAVRARLRAPTGDTRGLRDGVHGAAEVDIGSRSLLSALVPGAD